MSFPLCNFLGLKFVSLMSKKASTLANKDKDRWFVLLYLGEALIRLKCPNPFLMTRICGNAPLLTKRPKLNCAIAWTWQTLCPIAIQHQGFHVIRMSLEFHQLSTGSRIPNTKNLLRAPWHDDGTGGVHGQAVDAVLVAVEAAGGHGVVACCKSCQSVHIPQKYCLVKSCTRVATKILRRFYTLLGNNRFLSSDARFLALQIDSLTIPSPENWLFESSLQLWWICSLLYHANTMSILKRIKIFSKMYCREKKSGLVLTATTNRLFNDIIIDFLYIYLLTSL